MQKNIFIVDDEEDICKLVSLHLEKNNFKATTFSNAKTFFDQIKEKKPDLIILDIMLPDMDGLEVCKAVKSNKDLKKIPVIMLTAKQEEIDKIVGLEMGADDYITKPFSPREVVARVKAVLRRADLIDNIEINNEKIINIDNKIFINVPKYEVYDRENKKIELTQTEFNILMILLEKRGWVFSREKILNKLWGEDKYVIDRTIDVHIKNLREKLGETGNLIKNVRGVGYKLEDKG